MPELPPNCISPTHVVEGRLPARGYVLEPAHEGGKHVARLGELALVVVDLGALKVAVGVDVGLAEATQPGTEFHDRRLIGH